VAQDIFASNGPTTTVASAHGVVTAGTSETWTVASSTGFPAAVTGVSQFRIADRAAPAEIMIVTNVSGTTWTVTRGTESTTPVAHTAGFTVYQALTAGVLSGLTPVAVNVKNSGDTTGSADKSVIAAAITAAGTAGGGLVQLGAGSFYLNAGLTIPAGVTVAGLGAGLTTVKVANGASSFIPFLMQNVSGAGVRDLKLDLNSGGTSSGNIGIYANAGTTNMTGIDIRRVTVINGWQAGISVVAYPVSYTIGFTMEDVTVTGCAGSGISISGAQDATITRAAVSSCAGNGGGIFVGGSSGIKIIASESTGNTTHGLAFNAASYNLATSGFQVTGGNYSGNNAGGSTGYGIVVSEGCYDFTITGARCEGNGGGGIGVDVAWDATRTSGTAASGTTTTLTDSTAAWPLNSWTGWTVRFTSGTGSGQSAVITSNTATVLTFSAVTTAPDATTHYAIDGSRIFTPVAAAISGCICAYNTNQGFWVNYCSNLAITGCEIHHNGNVGVDLVAQYCLVTGNDIHDNTSYGVALNQGSDPMGGHRVTGNAYRSNAAGPNVHQAATTYANISDEYADLGQTVTLITVTNSASPIPPGANWLEILAAGGGGQGGGAGSAAATQLEGGAGGGAAGVASSQVVAVGANTTLNIVIGAGGSAAGAGGAAGGSAGGLGAAGNRTTVTGTGISVKGLGGAGGAGSAASSTTFGLCGIYGSSTQSSFITAGNGGFAGLAGGAPGGGSAGGGGSGQAATTTTGGAGGSAGTASAGGAAGTGGSGISAGGNGGAAAANSAAGGGGGGGGAAATGAGGNGGAGGSGFVIIRVVG
jgi:hypothetical protein